MDLILTRPAQGARQVGQRVSPSPRGPLTWFSAAEPRGSVAPAQGESASRTPGRTRFAVGPPWASRDVGQRPGSLRTSGREQPCQSGRWKRFAEVVSTPGGPGSALRRDAQLDTWQVGESEETNKPPSPGPGLGARSAGLCAGHCPGSPGRGLLPGGLAEPGEPAGIRGRDRARRQGVEGDALISAGDAAWENGVAPARRAVPLLGRLLPEAGPEGGVCRGVRRGAAQVRSPTRPAAAVPGFGARTRGARPQQGELRLNPRPIHPLNERAPRRAAFR